MERESTDSTALLRRIDNDRRVIWLLTRRLGGEVLITETELTDVPRLPELVTQLEPGRGLVIRAAQ